MPTLTHRGSVEQALVCVCDALSVLILAIQHRDYFSAWTAKHHLQQAIEEASEISRSLPAAHRQTWLARLNQIRELTLPAIALAPAPTRAELRALHSGDTARDREAWDDLEQRWCLSVASSVLQS